MDDTRWVGVLIKINSGRDDVGRALVKIKSGGDELGRALVKFNSGGDEVAWGVLRSSLVIRRSFVSSTRGSGVLAAKASGAVGLPVGLLRHLFAVARAGGEVALHTAVIMAFRVRQDANFPEGFWVPLQELLGQG